MYTYLHAMNDKHKTTLICEIANFIRYHCLLSLISYELPQTNMINLVQFTVPHTHVVLRLYLTIHLWHRSTHTAFQIERKALFHGWKPILKWLTGNVMLYVLHQLTSIM